MFRRDWEPAKYRLMTRFMTIISNRNVSIFGNAQNGIAQQKPLHAQQRHGFSMKNMHIDILQRFLLSFGFSVLPMSLNSVFF